MDELVAASLSRGLDSDKTRTCIADVKMKFLDYVLIFSTSLVLLYTMFW